MNVLFLTDKLMTGGAEIYFCRLENKLQQPGLTMYTAAADGELYDRLARKEGFTALTRTNHLHNIRRLCAKVKDCRIQLIHANSLRMVLYAILVRRLVRRPLKILYTKHNVTMLEGRYGRLLSAILNRFVSRIITVSEFERASLIRLGVHESRITTIHNGVDTRQFAFAGKREGAVRRIGILARLSREKNHSLFLKTAYELEISFPGHFQFHIGGDGPEHASIVQQAAELGLQERVHYAGQIRHPEAFIREMDVLLLTSEREVFPMVVLEAMAAGTPMIAIDRGGIKEAITDGQTGLLVPVHSQKEFAEQVLRLHFDVQLYEQIVKAARQAVEAQFTLDHMVQATLREYEACLQQEPV